MDSTFLVAIAGAVTGFGALANTVVNTIYNRRTSESVKSLDESKLDLSVAELSHDITMDIIKTLRTEIRDCHAERDEFRTLLESHGLIPKSGT